MEIAVPTGFNTYFHSVYHAEVLLTGGNCRTSLMLTTLVSTLWISLSVAFRIKEPWRAVPKMNGSCEVRDHVVFYIQVCVILLPGILVILRPNTASLSSGHTCRYLIQVLNNVLPLLQPPSPLPILPLPPPHLHQWGSLCRRGKGNTIRSMR